MSAFPSPASGHEEAHIAETLTEHLIRKPAVTRILKLDSDFDRMGLVKGNVVVIEVDRRPHDACLALVEQHGEMFFCQLYWRQGQCLAVTDDHRGRVTEDMSLQGVARCFIKDLLIE